MLTSIIFSALNYIRIKGAAVLRRPLTWGLLLGLGVITVAFWPFLIGKTLYFGDNFSLMVPGKLFTAFWMHQGLLPLWNPYLFAGIPWIGDINQSILYPSTLLFAIFPTGFALNLNTVLHVLSAWVGSFLLIHTLTKHKGVAAIAGMLFAFSTQLTGSLNNIATLQSISYMPWVVWATLPHHAGLKRLTMGVLAIALQVLAGYPQHVLYTLGFAAILSLSESWRGQKVFHWLKDWFIYWTTVVIASLGITAVSWLPFLSVMKNSTRATQSLEQATVGSLHPLELVKMVVPTIFDYPRGGMKWGLSWNQPPNVSLYFTWLFGLSGYWYCRQVLLKKKITRRVVVVSGLFLLGIAIALGKYMPGYTLLTEVPILGATRGPSTALMLSALAGPILFAEFLLAVKLPSTIKQWQRGLFGLGMLALIVLVAVMLAFPQLWHSFDGLVGGRLSLSVFHTLERDLVISKVILTAVVINALATVAAIFAWKHQKWAVMALIIGLDMVINVQGHYQFSSSQIYKPEFISQEGAFFATYSPSSRTLIRNYNAPYSGFDSFWNAAVVRAPFSDSFIQTGQDPEMAEHLNNMRYGLTPDWNQVAMVPTINGFTTLLPQDVHDRFGKEEDPRLNNLPEIEANHPLLKDWSLRWYLVDRFYPLYEGEPNYPIVAQNERWTLYELPFLSRFRFENGERAPYDQYVETPNKFQITVINNQQHQWFILADRFDKAWEATVNDQVVPIQNWQGMRAVPITEGDNQIVMRYQPWEWRVGLQVSLLSLAGFLLVVVLVHRHQRLISN